MAEHNRSDRCSAQRRNGSFCDAPSAPDMPFPICAKHAIRVYLRVAEIRKDALEGPKRLGFFRDAFEDLSHTAAELNRRAHGRNDKVYYLQIGDLIKIGTTSSLTTRMRSYPPNAKLLATEPGDYALEGERHGEFRSLLAAGHEWFRYEEPLISHIARLKAAPAA